MNTTTNKTRTKDSKSMDGSAALENAAYRITNPESSRTIRGALEKYGDCFAAFLLGTGVIELESDELIQTFEASYVMAASDKHMAFEGLALLTGLVNGYKARVQVEEGADVEISFVPRSDGFREQIAKDYIIVAFLSDCYVFDARVIHDRLNR